MSSHRRHFLRYCGIAGLGALAGCTNRSEVTETPTSTGSRQQDILLAEDGDSDDYFGEAVALSSDGTTAIVSAIGDDNHGGEDAGAAYVFEATDGSWTQQTKLTADDGDSGEEFGNSVALSSDGTTALIGAQFDDSYGNMAGSAYVFEVSDGSWTQQAKLHAEQTYRFSRFGSSVALSSDSTTALIGAYLDLPEPMEWRVRGGSTYVFEATDGSWSQQAKLFPDSYDERILFGSSVALSDNGTTACIGARAADTSNIRNSGSAYVFEDTGESWTQQAKLDADDGDESDIFGDVVSLSSDGTTAIIGARGDDGPDDENVGAAYIFEATDESWRQQTKLTDHTGATDNWFGKVVAISSDGMTAFIGDDSEESGSVAVFAAADGTWSQQTKLVSGSGNEFGNTIAVSGDGSIVCIGSPRDDAPNNEDTGAAYVYNLSGDS